jgi:SAM-dependent methyltransferase
MSRTCRACTAPLEHLVVDLGALPLANDFLPERSASLALPRFPLRLFVCDSCSLAQIDEDLPPDRLFGEYQYFSSYSDAWVQHAADFAEWAMANLALDESSLVVEVASNDGYLLRWFAARGIPVLGVEPAANVAEVAETSGVRSLVEYFTADLGRRLASEGHRADLVVANNVVAHVPDPRDLLAGFAPLLADDGLATIEVPHVLRMLSGVQFDTIYHEHYSYFSLAVLEGLAADVGLEVVDVEPLWTHGGSMRVHLRHRGVGSVSSRVLATREEEAAARLGEPGTYDHFAAQVAHALSSLRAFLADAREKGDLVAGYGAAAKGTVLLNAAGVVADDVALVGDRSPHKIGRFVPGIGIPIVTPRQMLARHPRHVLVFAWNLIDEIGAQLQEVRSWGGDLVTAIPETRVRP